MGILSGSQLGVSGPAAGLAVIVLAAITKLGFEAFLVAVVIAGLFQVILGFLRAGTIAYFFPSSVIKGMLAGIGVIIILKQIPHALGHDKDPEGEMQFAQPDGETTLSSLKLMIENLEIGAIIVSVVSLAILILWDRVLTKKHRFFRLVQGPLVAVAFGIVYQLVTAKYFKDLSLETSHRVAVPVIASLDQMKDVIVFPDWSQIKNAAVWITAATLAVVASLETLLCVSKRPIKHGPAAAPDADQPRTRRARRGQHGFGRDRRTAGDAGHRAQLRPTSSRVARTKVSAILHGRFLLVFVRVDPAKRSQPHAARGAGEHPARGGLQAGQAGRCSSACTRSSASSQFLPFVVTDRGDRVHRLADRHRHSDSRSRSS